MSSLFPDGPHLPAELDVAVGGAPWEGTATGRTGTHLGPRAVRECEYLGGATGIHHLETRVSPFEVLRVADFGDAGIFVGDTERTYESIRGFAREILDAWTSSSCRPPTTRATT